MLELSQFGNIHPLDKQMGAHPRKTVPDVLWDPLFGELAANPLEIEKFGPSARELPLKTYAVLSAAKAQTIPSLLQNSGLKYQSFFKGQARKEHEDTAPYLVELAADNELTRELLTDGNMPSNLWTKEAGIFIRSRSNFKELWSRLRKYLRIADSEGNWHFFAFWEPWYAQVLYERRDHLPTFGNLYARIADVDQILAIQPVSNILITINAKSVDKPKPLVLSAQLRAEMSRTVLYRNMILSAFDLHEMHADDAVKYGPEPQDLWPLLLDFADEIKDARLKDPELRARMMLLAFISYPEPWPAFIKLPFWQQIKQNAGSADDLFEDFCSRLKRQNIQNKTAESIWW